MIITESKATKKKHKQPSEEEQRMNVETEKMREALRDAMNGYLRVKDEMRPLLRDAVNKAEELGALNRKESSELRQEIRDGSKDALERMARGLRADLFRAGDKPEGAPEGAPEREEKPAETTPQPAPTTTPQPAGADTERVDAMEKKLDMIAEAILKGDKGAQPETPTTPDENGLIEHWALPRIFERLSTNKQVLLVGGAGTGKTTMGRQPNALLGHE